MKMNVGVIFGGRSVEHEVSIITAHQLLENIDRDKYRALPIYISKRGEWFSGDTLWKLDAFKNLAKLPAGLKRVCLLPYPAQYNLVGLSGGGIFKKGWQEQLEVVIPALHGTHGEDGSLQGLLELADIAYAGAGVLGSALGMDKIAMKAALREAGLPALDYLWFPRQQWEAEAEGVMNAVESKLGYPVFIKPADLGSSIGIGKADNRDDLCFALDVAGTYSRRLLVEKTLGDCLEINCAVLGDEEQAQASVCEQPQGGREFLTYEDKYLRGGSDQGMAGTQRRVPAPISEGLSKRLQGLACQAFRALAGRGVARVDFLLNKDTQEPYINEINTIPGSFAYYLWEAQGIGFSQLIDRLIELALKARQGKRQTTYSLEGNLLQGGSKLFPSSH